MLRFRYHRCKMRSCCSCIGYDIYIYLAALGISYGQLVFLFTHALFGLLLHVLRPLKIKRSSECWGTTHDVCGVLGNSQRNVWRDG